MKKIKVLFFLLISIIFSACHDGTIGGSGNIGYNVPALSTFSIEFEYYSTKEKVETFILKSKEIPSYDYQLIRLDEENVFLAISVEKVFEKKKANIHQECVIYGVNDKTIGVYLAEPISDFIAVSFTAILFTFQFKKSIKLISE